MGIATSPDVTIERGSTPPPSLPPKERLLSLDVFRGLTLVFMTLVNMPGDEDHTYSVITHAKWNGWSIADLIFPFFIFIVGVAMPYSFSKRLAQGDSKGKLIAHIALRSAVLFGVGVFMTWYYNVMSGLPYYHLSNIRIFGALQRIALCYLFASILYLTVKPKGLAAISTIILLGYFVLLKFVPVPGEGVVVLAKHGNWVQWVDLHLMPNHMWKDNWEPKGWLGTFPAVANMVIGVLTGLFLRSARTAREKVRTFLAVGTIGIVLGLLWSIWIPINQNLWTSSMVVFMSGLAVVILGSCYYFADVRKITGWTKPFVIVGVNSLFLWVVAGTTDSLTNLEHLRIGPEKIPFPLAVSHFFAQWIGATNASELYAFLWMTLWLGILTVMYKKRIWIKI
jgi:predicted acyltransferase